MNKESQHCLLPSKSPTAVLNGIYCIKYVKHRYSTTNVEYISSRCDREVER